MAERDGENVVVHIADHVLPVVSEPIDGGAVATQGGVILAVGPREDLLRQYDSAEEVTWTGVLTPGLVNAHAHLQYHGLAELGQTVHADFEAWSVAFDETYDAIFEQEDWGAAALQGAKEAIRTGTTTVADICTDLAAIDALPVSGLTGTTYIETLGSTQEQWQRGGREAFIDGVQQNTSRATSSFSIGISPHAPYSLDTAVLSDLASFSRASGMRIHTHLAESTFEDDYYQSGAGPLADFVASFGRGFQILSEHGAGQSAAEFARDLGLLGSDTHVAHGIYLDAAGRAILRETRTAVALCPRSNATIGLDPAPVAAYLDEGNHICVGTDSLSSTPSLDLLEDVRALHDIATDQGYDNPDLASRLIHAATVGGAQAIGMANGDYRVGALVPGYRANFAVFEIDTEVKSVERDIVLEGAGTCIATVIDGVAQF